MNRSLTITIAVLLAVSFALSIIVVLNHSNLIKDGWFIPVLAAQFWTICLGLSNNYYD